MRTEWHGEKRGLDTIKGTEIGALTQRIVEERASEHDISVALCCIEYDEIPEEDINGLIIAVSQRIDSPSPVPPMIRALESVHRTSKAILLIREIRRRGGASYIIPSLVEISEGATWDPGRQAWLVALRTLATHAQKTKDPRALSAVEGAICMGDLTDQQASWAKRCLSIARG